MNDISNLDQRQQAAGARRPAAAVRPRQPAVALRQLVQGDAGEILAAVGPASSRRRGGNTEFADMRAAYDALDDETQGAECEDLVCEHSQFFSRGMLGFTDFTEEERRKFAPVPQRLVRRHPVTGRRSLFLSSHAGDDRRLAGAGGARPPARPDRARDAARVRLRPSLAAVGSGHVGQPRDDASRAAATTTRRCATCTAPRWPTSRLRWNRRPDQDLGCR